MKRKGLGRGINALLGGADNKKAPAEAVKSALNIADVPIVESGPQDGKLMELPIEFLQRGKYQPRRDMHEEALQ